MQRRKVPNSSEIESADQKQANNDLASGSSSYLEGALGTVAGAIKVTNAKQVLGDLSVDRLEKDFATVGYSSRIKDALARLFHVGKKCKCCAVAFGEDNKIYISHNTGVNADTIETVKSYQGHPFLNLIMKQKAV